MMQRALMSFLLPAAWAQFVANFDMRPDLTFGSHNDRFDVRTMVDRQNRLYDRTQVDDGDNYRRFESAGIEELAATLREAVRNNRDFSELTYHDGMESEEAASDDDYERNLQRFKYRRLQPLVDYLHGGRSARRSDGVVADPEKEVLFHHAVPVEMKISGYIQAPFDE